MSIITDPIFYLIAIPAVILLGMSKGGFAGIGVVTTPLISLYLPPLEAAALILPTLITQDLISVWWYRKDWDPWNLKVMLPGALVGMGLAWAFAGYVTDSALRIVIGTIGISFVLYYVVKHQPAEGQRKTAFSGFFWGGVSGFTSFLSQAGGPPLSGAYAAAAAAETDTGRHHHDLLCHRQRAEDRPYFALGQFNTRNIVTSLVLLPIAVAGNAFGIWLVRVTPQEAFYKIAYTIVACVSVMLLWQGISGLLRG